MQDNSNPEYQIFARNKAGVIVGEVTDWFNLSFGDKMNNYGKATFDIPNGSPDLAKFIAPRKYETLIKRNGTTIWSGEQALRKVTLRENDANLVTITSYTFPEMLKARFSPFYVRYNSTDQGQIIKLLIDYSQGRTNGDFGFTFASIPTTITRDREYFTYSILEAMINMSNLINGIDFWIDENKVIYIKPYRGANKQAQYVFEYGVNMLNTQITDDFSSPANTARLLGTGFGTGQLNDEYADASARAEYLLREQKVTDIDVTELATLLDKGENFVNKYRRAVRTIEFQQLPKHHPPLGTLNIGDVTRTRVRDGSYNVDDPCRIYGYDALIGKNGEEYVTWIIAEEEYGIS